MKRVIDGAWATCAIGLGVWETTAITTKRVPTISKTCAIAKRRHKNSVNVAVIAWLLGLGLHLMRHHVD